MNTHTAATVDPKVGLLEFDSFNSSDITNFLNVIGANPSIAGQLSEVPVDGGVAPGPDESEVLLDIEAAMVESEADPAVSYVVYDAPTSASFQQVLNAMINDGDSVISNSWSQCEDQTSLADAQSIDSILAQAAASGISVINGSGDGGSTCLDGSANTVGVPADSPNATSVGASTLLAGPGGTYGSESWWNGANDQQVETGAGGFGVSKYFARPTYQNSLTTAVGRSVPDLVVPSDPGINGLPICEADNGGCPNNSLYGGTSLAAPELAGVIGLIDADDGSQRRKSQFCALSTGHVRDLSPTDGLEQRLRPRGAGERGLQCPLPGTDGRVCGAGLAFGVFR